MPGMCASRFRTLSLSLARLLAVLVRVCAPAATETKRDTGLDNLDWVLGFKPTHRSSLLPIFPCFLLIFIFISVPSLSWTRSHLYLYFSLVFLLLTFSFIACFFFIWSYYSFFSQLFVALKK